MTSALTASQDSRRTPARRLVLSRKGFDSASGGGPSPVMPDGRMISLPIPEEGSEITYGSVGVPGLGESYYEVMTRLGITKVVIGGKRLPLTPSLGVHLDPDLQRETRQREAGWLPNLGQVDAAQSHLRNQGVEAGDLMLFFGLYRRTALRDGRLVMTGPRFHAVWGWLEIGGIISVRDGVPAWAADHPHVLHQHLPVYTRGDNVLYSAGPACTWATDALAGAGTLNLGTGRTLSAGNGRCSTWRLPKAFHPSLTRQPLTYHPSAERWRHDGDQILLNSAGRGQEFVVQATPGIEDWVATILAPDDSDTLVPGC